MDINASLEQKVPNRTPSLSISYKLDFCNAQDQITTQNNTQFLKKKRFNNDNYFKTINSINNNTNNNQNADNQEINNVNIYNGLCLKEYIKNSEKVNLNEFEKSSFFIRDKALLEKKANIKLSPMRFAKGGYGLVYQGKKSLTNSTYAIKFIRNPCGITSALIEKIMIILNKKNMQMQQKRNQASSSLLEKELKDSSQLLLHYNNNDNNTPSMNSRNNENKDMNFLISLKKETTGVNHLINNNNNNTNIDGFKPINRLEAQLDELSDKEINMIKSCVNIIKNECNILGHVKNKNCIKCHAIFNLENSVALVLDYCSNGDLYLIANLHYTGKLNQNQIHARLVEKKFFESKKLFPFLYYLSETFVRFFFMQMLNSLSYMRHLRLVHHDIKLDNFLLDRNLVLKLSDFALSNKVASNEVYKIIQKGTYIYMAPELSREYPNNTVAAKDAFKIDYFALGVCLYKLVMNCNIIAKDEHLTFENYSEKLIKKFSTIESAFEERQSLAPLSYEFYDLVKRLLDPSISTRIDLKEIYQHEWLKNKKNRIINDSINFYYSIYDPNFLKFMTELNKIEYSSFLKYRYNEEDLFKIDEELLEII